MHSYRVARKRRGANDCCSCSCMRVAIRGNVVVALVVVPTLVASLQCSPRRNRRQLPGAYSPRTVLFFSDENKNAEDNAYFETTQEEDDLTFLRRELAHLQDLEQLLAELEEEDEEGSLDPSIQQWDYSPLSDNDDEMLWDTASLNELIGSLEGVNDSDFNSEPDTSHSAAQELHALEQRIRQSSYSQLERAVSFGVVPANANVGSDCMVGDLGFDPWQLATRDLFRPAQAWLSRLLPAGRPAKAMDYTTPRPRALILRDYREAEIRHGRLAMLAAVIWPLQEMLDRLVLDESQCDAVLFLLLPRSDLFAASTVATTTTLPYFPLFMTATLLLLGYLDVYSQAIKDLDELGEAYEPGDCFWDPLQISQSGLPSSAQIKRNMQEREILNGRMAMLAVAAFGWEEFRTGQAVVALPNNALLFTPLYQIPYVQEYLDQVFTVHDAGVAFPDVSDVL
jgi:light-harvesting complex I chlorophyll a/b binding protein 1